MPFVSESHFGDQREQPLERIPFRCSSIGIDCFGSLRRGVTRNGRKHPEGLLERSDLSAVRSDLLPCTVNVCSLWAVSAPTVR